MTLEVPLKIQIIWWILWCPRPNQVHVKNSNDSNTEDITIKLETFPTTTLLIAFKAVSLKTLLRFLDSPLLMFFSKVLSLTSSWLWTTTFQLPRSLNPSQYFWTKWLKQTNTLSFFLMLQKVYTVAARILKANQYQHDNSWSSQAALTRVTAFSVEQPAPKFYY